MKTRNGTAPPSSVAAWQARAEHRVQCPSGQWLKIRVPGIATLLERGDLPEDLLELAFAEAERVNGAIVRTADRMQADGASREERLAALKEFADFQRWLSRQAIVAVGDQAGDQWTPVALTDDTIRELPEDDLAMIAEIVMRLRGEDARGVTVGVAPLDRWAMFRELHSCDPDCGACEEIRQRLSTADLVPL